MGAFEASRGSGFERFVVEDVILRPTAGLINLIFPTDHVELVGRTFVSGGARMRVTRGCEGVEMFLLLSAAIVAFPASLKHRLKGLSIGFVLAYILSLARLTALVYTLRHAPDAWEALHGLILPLAPSARDCVVLFALVIHDCFAAADAASSPCELSGAGSWGRSLRLPSAPWARSHMRDWRRPTGGCAPHSGGAALGGRERGGSILGIKPGCSIEAHGLRTNSSAIRNRRCGWSASCK